MNTTHRRVIVGATLAIWAGAGLLGLAVHGQRSDDAPRALVATAAPSPASTVPAGMVVPSFPSRTSTPGAALGSVAARVASIGIPTKPSTRPTTHSPKPVPRPTKTTAKPVAKKTTKAAPVVATSYANCTAVRKAGAAPIHRGEPGYSRKLDRDGDGVGCES